MLTRRTLLKRLSLIAAGAALPPLFISCTEDLPDAGAGMPEPYATWSRLQTLTRSSSDHFPARLQKAADAGDWREIYSIVRQNFITLPNPGSHSVMGMPKDCIRAGTYACERAGAGTIVEQSKVLIQYLERTGLTAEIYKVPTALNETAQRAQFTRNMSVDYDAELPDQLSNGGGPAGSQVMAGSDRVDPLRERVFDTLPELDPDVREVKTVTENIPLVVVHDEAGTKFVLPLVGEGSEPVAMDSFEGGKMEPAVLPARGRRVTCSINAQFRNQSAETVLVSHEFDVAELAGRHLNVTFDHGIPMEALASKTIGSITTFTPTFQIARLSTDPLYNAGDPPVVGEGFTVFGEKVEVGDGNLNGIPMEANPDLAATVTEVRIEAQGLNYPEVRAKVWAFDASGEAVEGLSSADILIEDNGQPLATTLRQNSVSPTVHIQYDTSGSVPEELRRYDYIDAYEAKMRDSIQEIYPLANVILYRTKDKYYDQLTEAALSSPDLIICVSDGQIIGEQQPHQATALATLPPLIFIHIVEEVHPDLVTLAEVVDVTPIPSTDEAALLADLRQKLQPEKIAPYELSYLIDHPEGAVIPVRATIGKQRATTEYEVMTDATGPVLTALFLDVKWGYDNVSRFTLGGHDPRVTKTLSADHVTDAFESLFATTSLYVEGMGATTAVITDDFLSGRLSTQEMMEVESPHDNFDEFKEKLAKIVVKDLDCLSLVQALPGTVDADSLTYPEGLRVCARQTKYNLTDGKQVTRVSILPSAKWVTLHSDPQAAIRKTFNVTWELVMAEKALYPTNTYTLLQDDDLFLATEIVKSYTDTEFGWTYDQMDQFRGALSAYDRKFGDGRSEKIAGRQTKSPVWFNVYTNTGEVIGILPDLTGGGADVKARLKRLKKIDQVLQVYLSGAGAAGLAVVAVFFSVVGKWYIIAATHVTTLDATMDSRCEMIKAVKGAAIDTMVGAIIGAYVPRASAAIGVIQAAEERTTASKYTLKDCAKI